MTGKEKLYFLLDRIEDERELTPSGQPIRIHPVRNLNSKYHRDELIRLLSKLEKDEKVIRIIELPSNIGGYLTNEKGFFVIELLPTYADYYANIQCEPAHQE